MAMTGIPLIMTLEGIVGNTVGAGLSPVPYPQSNSLWLKAMKENILFMARNIEDSFVLDIFPDVDESEETVQAAATYLLGFLGRSANTVAEVIQFWDVGTPTPGTTATGQHGTLQLPIGSATAPSIGGVVWFPYEYFGTTCLVSATSHSDYATGMAANLTQVWSIRRDE